MKKADGVKRFFSGEALSRDEMTRRAIRLTVRAAGSPPRLRHRPSSRDRKVAVMSPALGCATAANVTAALRRRLGNTRQGGRRTHRVKLM